MKDKVERLAKGIFEYEQPAIVISEEMISAEIPAGEVFCGKFSVRNRDMRVMKGVLYSSDEVLELNERQFIGADNEFFMKPLPYLRVLGFSKKGAKHLKNLKNSSVPLINKASDINSLSANAKMVFKTEAKATDLFGLSLETPLECGLEYTRKIIKTE